MTHQHTGPGPTGGRIRAGRLTAVVPAAAAPPCPTALPTPPTQASATHADGRTTAVIPADYPDAANLTMTDAGTHHVNVGDYAYARPMAELGGSAPLIETHRGIIVDVSARWITVLFDDVPIGVPNLQTFRPAELRVTHRTVPALRHTG